MHVLVIQSHSLGDSEDYPLAVGKGKLRAKLYTSTRTLYPRILPAPGRRRRLEVARQS